MSRERLPEKNVEADEFELPEELEPAAIEPAKIQTTEEPRYEVIATALTRVLAPNPLFEHDPRLRPREERAIIEIFEAARGHDQAGRHISAGVRLTRLNRGLSLLRPLLAPESAAANPRNRALREEIELAVKKLREELKQRIGVEGVEFEEEAARKPDDDDDDDKKDK